MWIRRMPILSGLKDHQPERISLGKICSPETLWCSKESHQHSTEIKIRSLASGIRLPEFRLLTVKFEVLNG